jgi:ribonuclease BN (tRNA processing enzyme)
VKIKFLGSGSAWVFAEENFQSNILISKEVDGYERNFLYDAGTTISESLEYHKIKPQDIDTLFISHLHADHSGGVEDLGFKTYFQQFPFGVDKITLCGTYDILSEGWDKSWRGGMENLSNETATLETYFETKYLEEHEPIIFFETTIRPVKTIHVETDKRVVPSYGLFVEGDNKNVFITGDSIYQPNQFHPSYMRADIIFQDCDFNEYEGGVHAQFHQLCNLPKEFKRKMWLYHFALNGKHIWELDTLAEDNGFAGVVRRGQEFEC